MPAPTPIDIRYGDPTMLGQLAGAAGTAGYRLDSLHRDQDNWMQRAQMDNQFLIAEANRRSEESQNDALMRYRYGEAARDQSNTDRAFGLQSAVAGDRSARGYASMETKASIAEQARIAAEQRLKESLAARRNGSAKSGRSSADLSLVPASGDIPLQGAEEPTSQIISHGDGPNVERYRGENISYYGGPMSQADARGEVDSRIRPHSDMVPRYVRSQLDYLETLKGQIPEDRLNALRIAARSGELKMDQLNDDARQMFPHQTSATRDLATKNAEKMGLTAKTIDEVLASNLPEGVKADYGRKVMNINPIFDETPDAEILSKMAGYRKSLDVQIGATKPVMNSSGRTPTGGNVMNIQGDAEYRSLPSGAYYSGPDGVTRRKP